MDLVLKDDLLASDLLEITEGFPEISKAPINCDLSFTPSAKKTIDANSFRLKQNLSIYLVRSLWAGLNIDVTNTEILKKSSFKPFIAFYSKNKTSFIRTGLNMKNEGANVETSFYNFTDISEFALDARLGPDIKLKSHYIHNKYGGLVFKDRECYRVGYMLKRNIAPNMYIRYQALIGGKDYESSKLDNSLDLLYTTRDDLRMFLKLKTVGLSNFCISAMQSLVFSPNFSIFLETQMVDDGVCDYVGVYYRNLKLKLPIRFWLREDHLTSVFFMLGSMMISNIVLRVGSYIKKRMLQVNESGKEKAYEEQLNFKMASDQIIKLKLERAAASATGLLNILFACVVNKEHAERVKSLANSYDEEKTRDLLQSIDGIDITYTCKLYAKNDKLELPSKKSKLIGFLMPKNGYKEPRKYSICVIYRVGDAGLIRFREYPIDEPIKLP